MNIERLRATLKRDEGVYLQPYCDTMKIPTVGVGRNLRDVGYDGKKYKTTAEFTEDYPNGLTLEQVEAALEEDIQKAISGARSLAGDHWNSLSMLRQEVLVNMTFNMGKGGVQGFKRMWKAIREQKYERAALEMCDSCWFKQVHARALRLACVMLTNNEQCFQITDYGG